MVTAVLAVVLSVILAFTLNGDVVAFLLIPLWLVLYYGWPYLSRRLPFLEPDKPASPEPKRPLWLHLIRGTLTSVGAVLLALVCMLSLVVVPIALCERRAQRVANSIHPGMTVEEVLHTARDCDVFGAGSEAPYDKDANADERSPPCTLIGGETARM